MLSFFASIALLICVILFVFSRKSFPGNIFLAGYFGVSFLWSLTLYADFFSDNLVFSALMHGHFQAFFYLTGPFLYIYVRSLINDNAKLYWYDSLHLIPMIILLIGIFPYYFVDFDVKMKMLHDLNRLANISEVNYNINFLVPQKFIISSRPLIIVGYNIVTLYLLLKNKQYILDNPNVEKSFSEKFGIWLTFFISATFIFSALMAVFTIKGVYAVQPIIAWHNMKLLSNSIQIIYIILNISIFFVPNVMYGLPRNIEFSQINENPEILVANESVTPEKNLLLFTEDYIAKIKNAVDTEVNKNSFLQFNFNKFHLSQLTHVPEHHLTYFFNVILDKSFSDWRNELRVNYAIELLKTGITKIQTMESLATMCGYSNQSTFFASFKKVTGFTPGEYLKVAILPESNKFSANV